MAELIYVQAGPAVAEGKVAIWDHHPDHPATTEFPNGQEAFVAANGVTKLVARTPDIEVAIRNDRLVVLSGKDAKTAATAAPSQVDPGSVPDAGGPTANPQAGSAAGQAG